VQRLLPVATVSVRAVQLRQLGWQSALLATGYLSDFHFNIPLLGDGIF
jgi:hypothetical protein